MRRESKAWAPPLIALAVALASVTMSAADLLAGQPADARTRAKLEPDVLKVIVGDANGAPVRKAKVSVTYGANQTKSKKSNSKGIVRLKGIRATKVTVQVVARGWKTFGKQYAITSPSKPIHIRLKPRTPPAGQNASRPSVVPEEASEE